MSPKKKSSARQVLQLIFAFILVGLYFVYQTYEDQYIPNEPEVQGVSTSTKSAETEVNIPSVENNLVFETYFTSPLSDFAGNTGDSIEQDLIDKINSANTSLYGAFYEFDLDSVADAFIAAHKRGIEVIIVYDNKGTKDDPQIKRITESGIVTISDNRSNIMHNKFLVVDSQCVWTGSFNITENAAYRNNEDAVYICNSLLAENYEAEFSEMFNNQFGARSPANTPNPKIVINGVLVETYFAPEDDVMSKVISTVASAESTIHFLAYSFTDKKLANTMLFRQNNYGVNISGVFEVRMASIESSQCMSLLRNGANVLLDGNSGTMHHKVIIIDSKIVIFGSFNLSANANENNDENLLIIHSPALANSYEQEFQKLFSQGKIPNRSC